MPDVARNRGYSNPKKKVLIVVTAGGYTHAAPLFEIASILATRGYVIELATFAGRAKWTQDKPFISRTHQLGLPPAVEVEEAVYVRLSTWPSDLTSNWEPLYATKKFLESSWPDVYRGLTHLVADAATRPDFLLADCWVQATQDISIEHTIPLAMHWPQMPTGMLTAPHIPGTPGLQVDILTSEFATIWQRLNNAVAIYTSLPHYLRYLRWVKNMRRSIGVSRQLPRLTKPDYLCLVNSFFGLEAAKDIPPNVAAVGPILSEQIEPLSDAFIKFLGSRSRVVYICLGTRVLLSHRVLFQLLAGAVAALTTGAIDGIIWSIPEHARAQLDGCAQIMVPSTRTAEEHSKNGETYSTTLDKVLDNVHPSILVVDFAPQRAILQDNRIAVFLSHAGSSSANEALYAGVPLITLPVYNDQLQIAMRLRDAGVSIPLQKETSTADDVQDAVRLIVGDRERHGPISLNVCRMRKIAHIAARRKHLAADLIEEVLADWDSRRHERELGTERPRGMHLQTADARMPWWKARNWDVWGLAGLSILAVGGGGLVTANYLRGLVVGVSHCS